MGPGKARKRESGNIQRSTFNAQHSTLNIQSPTSKRGKGQDDKFKSGPDPKTPVMNTDFEQQRLKDTKEKTKAGGWIRYD
jgi:hypothetical protein